MYVEDEEDELQKLLGSHNFSNFLKCLEHALPRLKLALASLLAPAPPRPADASADAAGAEDLVALANLGAAAATTGCYWKTPGCTFGPNNHPVCSSHMASGKRQRTGGCK